MTGHSCSVSFGPVWARAHVTLTPTVTPCAPDCLQSRSRRVTGGVMDARETAIVAEPEGPQGAAAPPTVTHHHRSRGARAASRRRLVTVGRVAPGFRRAGRAVRPQGVGRAL